MYTMEQKSIFNKCSILKVFKVFTDEPLKIHYIKEISRKISLAPTSVKNHIQELEKQNLIIKKQGERFFGYISNRENDNFLFYKKLLNLSKLKESGLLDYLIESFYPKSIILYGSYLSGEDVESSDIDLMIVSKTRKIVETNKFEKILKRKIHIIIESNIKGLISELKSEVVNGLVLYGYLNIDK